MSYIKWHDEARNVIEEVRCLDCDVPLVKLVRSNNLLERKTINGVVKEFYFALHSATPQYDTITIDMEDGSKMEVPICKDCKPHIQTPEDEQRIVQSGIEAMEDEDSRAGSARRITPEFKARLPKRLAEQRKPQR